MKMKLGTIVTEMSGKLGGHCVSNYGGQVVLAKNKQGGTFGSNSAARGVRYRSAVAANWRQLTQAERQGYSQIGQNNVKSFNANNSLINATGYEVNFQRVASELLFGAPQTDDPTHTNTAHVEIQGVFVSGVYPDITNVQLFTNLLPQFSKLRLRISEPIPHGVSTPRKRWNEAQGLVTLGNPPINITQLLDGWVLKDKRADHFYLEAQVQDEWGNLSPKVYYRVDFQSIYFPPEVVDMSITPPTGAIPRTYRLQMSHLDKVIYGQVPSAGFYRLRLGINQPVSGLCLPSVSSASPATQAAKAFLQGQDFVTSYGGAVNHGECMTFVAQLIDWNSNLVWQEIRELSLL